MDKEREAKYDACTLDELFAYRDSNTQGLNEARKIVREFNDSLTMVNEAINRKKLHGIKKSVKKDMLAKFGEMGLSNTKKVAAEFEEFKEKIVQIAPKKPAKIYEPKISDHALIRYAERILGLDIQKLRTQIMTKENYLALQLGATLIVANDIKLVAREGKIVTVIDTGQETDPEPMG